MAKEFIYEGEKYQVDSSKNVFPVGDVDPATKTILVDKDLPEKFHEGIAVHEVEERKLLMKGHSYVYSHNEAQKKELEFYKKVYGEENAMKVLEEEEDVVLTITSRHATPKKTKIIYKESGEGAQAARPLILVRTTREVIFENKRYTVDNSERLIGTLADVYERGDVIYIDKDVPERFYENLALHELVMRKNLKRGLRFAEANIEADKIEQDFLAAKYGAQEGKEIFDDEKRLQAWKFANEKRELREEGGHHKVIYEKGEILPK